MLRLKHGVDLRGLQPPLIFALVALDSLCNSYNASYLITSVCDDAPGRLPDSLHRKGLAFDFTILNPTRILTYSLASDILTSALGPQFDVVLESDHIHVEFDPKI